MNFNARKTIRTADGSPTLALEGHDETYHSRHGAIQESRYVFIEQGLEARSLHPKGTLRVFELGFGTGLNALLAWEWAERNAQSVVFESIEAYPLREDEWASLDFDVDVPGNAKAFDALHQAAWESEVSLSPHFSVLKKKATWLDFQVSDLCDVLFFDAFGPPTQPDMWTSLSLKTSVDLLSENGIWVSYCSKGQVRRDLEAAGLDMEKLPGPPGKRQMLRGMKPIQHALTTDWNIRCYMLLLKEDESGVLVSDEQAGSLEMTKFPGGGLELGEGPVGCLEREAIEELGQEIEVMSHFYTTEWFQRSRFRSEDQLLSMYYRVKFRDESVVCSQLDSGTDARDKHEVFRWVSWAELKHETLTFPVDRWVRELLLRSFAPELADPGYRPEYS